MDAQKIAAIARKIVKLGFEEAMRDPELDFEKEEILSYFRVASETATERVIDRLGEANFVAVLALIQSVVIATMVSHGAGSALAMDMMVDNDLKGYTHTIATTILGIAMQEEIL